MQRIETEPRPHWEHIIKEQGLIYSFNEETGKHYWNESAYYSFTLEEVLDLERVTDRLHKMSLEAAKFLAEEQLNLSSPWRLRVPQAAIEYAAHSLNRYLLSDQKGSDLDLYGRFDLVYHNQDSPAKMLEYNADTPTGLLESSAIQWFWKEDIFPDNDQWNGLHEALVQRWADLRKTQVANNVLYLVHSGEEESGEDMLNVAYLRDTANEAGWETQGIALEDIGYDHDNDCFVDLDMQVMHNVFKLWPWENLMVEPFGEHLARLQPFGWVEPAWKMFLSTKMLPAALWHLYPGDENLLPTYLNSPKGLTEYVKKPLHGREGAGVDIFAKGITQVNQDQRWGDEGFVYQAFHELPNFKDSHGNNNYAILGSWVVDGESYGVGIRESDGLITNYDARFVPNIIQ